MKTHVPESAVSALRGVDQHRQNGSVDNVEPPKMSRGFAAFLFVVFLGIVAYAVNPDLFKGKFNFEFPNWDTRPVVVETMQVEFEVGTGKPVPHVVRTFSNQR